MTSLAHISDLHLGFQSYTHLTPSGANQRAVDVALAFRSAVDAILVAKPDVVLVAGDVFHTRRPDNPAIMFAFDQFERLVRAGCRVVVIAGNHDTPRLAETGCLLPLFRKCGVDVAHAVAHQFVYPELDLRVTAAPHTAVMLGEIPLPQGPERCQVLLAHAEMRGGYGGERPCGQIPADVLAAGWSYVALGDYHIAHEVAPCVWYAGSIEYTSSNPWAELQQPKSWLLVDTDTGTVEPQSITLARSFYDLPEINAADLDPTQVDALIADRLAAVDITGAVVRLKVVNLARGVSRNLDHKAIRKAKGRALHFQLDIQVPDIVVSGAARQYDRRQSLGDIVAAFLGGYQYTPGIDGAAVARIGARLLTEVADAEAEKPGQREVA